VNVARNGFPCSIIVFIAALSVQIPLYCQRGSDSVDRSLAIVYLDRAIAFHEDGQDGPALALLEEALSLSGQSPDILYFMAKIDAPQLSPEYSLRVSKVARLEAALALGGFGKFSREDAVGKRRWSFATMPPIRSWKLVTHSFSFPAIIP
jgi:hypothetical protein